MLGHAHPRHSPSRIHDFVSSTSSTTSALLQLDQRGSAARKDTDRVQLEGEVAAPRGAHGGHECPLDLLALGLVLV